MMQKYIHHVRVERPPAGESAAEARERLRDKFPRPALRRMTHLGMLVGSTLEGVTIQPDDALVYASTYAETRALEDFLASFPAPSPLLFQTSIHPGAVQQVLIGRQQPVARLWPLAGRARLIEHALATALLETATRVIMVGGEERGTWLLEHGLASARAFAFGMVLSDDPAGSLGALMFAPESSPASPQPNPQTGIRTPPLPPPAGSLRDGNEPATPCPPLPDFADALAERRPLTWRSGRGTWTLAWS